MINFTGSYTDQYQLTMAQTYFLQGKANEIAVFDYFFRKNPFGGSYTLFAGLDDLLTALETLHFSRRDIDFLYQQGFHPAFLNYLENFRFQGNIYAAHEGDLVFPSCPVVIVEANLIEAQLIETLLLNLLNFQSLIATKASRMRDVAGDRTLIDFGMRRAQGPAAYYASRAAYIGGFDSTSNVTAARDYQIPLSGTMAHAFVQSYPNELTAFRDFAKYWPENTVLLVDTYNTLNSGLPNAIKVAQEMEASGQQLKGVRLDSGDLAYLAKEVRKQLNQANLSYVKIAVSNQLDEHSIQRLLDQQAPIDVFGVGTSLVTGMPDAALDGVYKLALINNQPCIKLSDSSAKITLPHKKQVYRLLNSEGVFVGADLIALSNEEEMTGLFYPFDASPPLGIDQWKKEALLALVVKRGQRLLKKSTVEDLRYFSMKRRAQLPAEYKRLLNPGLYKVGLSELLKTERDSLITALTAKNCPIIDNIAASIID